MMTTLMASVAEARRGSSECIRVREAGRRDVGVKGANLLLAASLSKWWRDKKKFLHLSLCNTVEIKKRKKGLCCLMKVNVTASLPVLSLFLSLSRRL